MAVMTLEHRLIGLKGGSPSFLHAIYLPMANQIKFACRWDLGVFGVWDARDALYKTASPVWALNG